MELLEISQEEIEKQILHYEHIFEMSSEEFEQRMHDGTIEDSFETMDWMILLRHCWNKIGEYLLKKNAGLYRRLAQVD